MKQFVGIDPGGLSAMGWCVMTVRDADVRLDTGICTGAETCLNLIASCVDRLPVAVGIDAPLYWAYDGDRVSDRRIRAAVASVGGSGGTINHVNSLRGACLVQGILAAVAIAQRWPSTRVTEAHPKALLRIWPEANAFVSKHTFRTDHERTRRSARRLCRRYAHTITHISPKRLATELRRLQVIDSHSLTKSSKHFLTAERNLLQPTDFNGIFLIYV